MKAFMNSEIPFITNPFFWIILTALCCGAAVSRITTFTRKAKNRENAKLKKWSFIWVYFSLATGLLLCGIFIPGPERFRDLRLLYLFAGSFVLFFFIFRFKKAVGLPFVLLFVFFCIILLLFFQSLFAFTGETAVATIRVLDLSDSRMELEVARDPDNPAADEIVELEGDYFATVVKLVIFEDYLVFLGAKTWYRFIGLSSFRETADGEIPVQQDRYHFLNPPGISESLYAFFEENQDRIPGVKAVEFPFNLKKPRLAAIYTVMLQNDGGIEIIQQ